MTDLEILQAAKDVADKKYEEVRLSVLEEFWSDVSYRIDQAIEVLTKND